MVRSEKLRLLIDDPGARKLVDVLFWGRADNITKRVSINCSLADLEHTYYLTAGFRSSSKLTLKVTAAESFRKRFRNIPQVGLYVLGIDCPIIQISEFKRRSNTE